MNRTRAHLERAVARAERVLIKARERMAKFRRRLPHVPVEDYSLAGPGRKRTRLSDAFGKHRDLILIHNMGKRCPYCTMWADGFNGVLKHLESRAAFVVVSPDLPAVQARFSRARGWKFRMLSARGTSFAKDLGFEKRDGRLLPGVSVFRKGKDGRIVRVSKAQFGPGDDFCSVWHLFGLLPKGAADWQPRFRY